VLASKSIDFNYAFVYLFCSSIITRSSPLTKPNYYLSVRITFVLSLGALRCFNPFKRILLTGLPFLRVPLPVASCSVSQPFFFKPFALLHQIFVSTFGLGQFIHFRLFCHALKRPNLSLSASKSLIIDFDMCCCGSVSLTERREHAQTITAVPYSKVWSLSLSLSFQNVQRQHLRIPFGRSPFLS
jgi:hypothetical protein